MKFLSFISTTAVDKLIVNHFWELSGFLKLLVEMKVWENAKQYFWAFLPVPRIFFLFISLL